MITLYVLQFLLEILCIYLSIKYLIALYEWEKLIINDVKSKIIGYIFFIILFLIGPIMGILKFIVDIAIFIYIIFKIFKNDISKNEIKYNYNDNIFLTEINFLIDRKTNKIKLEELERKINSLE